MSSLDTRCAVFLDQTLHQQILDEVVSRVAQDAACKESAVLGFVKLDQLPARME